MEEIRLESQRSRLVGIEAKSIRSFHFSPSTSSVTPTDHENLHDVPAGDAENVSVEDGFQIHVGAVHGNEDETEGKEGGEDDPDGGVLADAAFAL